MKELPNRLHFRFQYCNDCKASSSIESMLKLDMINYTDNNICQAQTNTENITNNYFYNNINCVNNTDINFNSICSFRTEANEQQQQQQQQQNYITSKLVQLDNSDGTLVSASSPQKGDVSTTSHSAHTTEGSHSSNSSNVISGSRTPYNEESLNLNLELTPKGYFREQDELENYLLIEQIGEGAFAKVFKAIPININTQSLLNRHDNYVAIKVARKFKQINEATGKKLRKTKRKDIVKEVSIHKKVSGSCPHIVKLLDFQESESYYYIVEEIVNGGEIFNQIIKYTYFSEDLCRHIIKQLGLAVYHLHLLGVIHRDIKPENMLFQKIDMQPSLKQKFRKSDNKVSKMDEGNFTKNVGGGGIGIVKLTDFGLSKELCSPETATPCGTLGYVAPEIITNHNYSNKVDLWGIGCVLYTLLCGFPPFFDDDTTALKHKIRKGEYNFLEPWWNEISNGAKYCVSRLLEVEPNNRYSITEFLNDPWLNAYDCDIKISKSSSAFNLSKSVSKTTDIPRMQFFDRRSSQRATILRNFFEQTNTISRMRDSHRQNLLERKFKHSKTDRQFDLRLKSSTIYNRRNSNQKHNPSSIACTKFR